MCQSKMAIIEPNGKLSDLLEQIIGDNLDERPAGDGPIQRLLLWLNRLNLEFSLGTLQGFDLACPLAIGNEPKSFWAKCRRFVRLKRAPTLYYLVVLVLIYAAVASIFNLRFQYAYDANKAVMERIAHQLLGRSRYSFRVNNRNGSEFLDQIEARAHGARSWLKRLGAARVEWSFGSEIMYIYTMAPSLILVLAGPICMRFNGLGYFSWTRWLFDEMGERRLWARLVVLELGKFEQLMLLAFKIDFSNGKSNMNRLRFAARHLATRRASVCSLPGSISGPSPGQRFNGIIGNELLVRGDLMQHRHSSANRQLKFIALRRRLGALGRTRRSLVSMSCTMMLLVVAQSVYMICLVVWTHNRLSQLFVSYGKLSEFVSLEDYIESSCLVYFVLLSCCVCITVKSYNLVTACDQVKSVNKVNKLIRQTLTRNEFAFQSLVRAKSARRASAISLRSCRQWTGEQVSAGALQLQAKLDDWAEWNRQDVPDLLDRLELDLLTIIVEYRLFVAQYELAMRPARFYGPFYLYLTLSLALLIRVHAPYLHPELKVLGAYLSYVFMAPQYIFLVPLCYLHQRCLVTFKALYSLAAQLAYYETVLSLRGCVSLEMVIVSLKRCLIRPEHAKAKFTCRIMFFDATYATMLKITFWISLLIIPMLSLRQTNEDLVGSLMSDPFGIFSFK